MLICKYTFNNTLYDFIPYFNSEYESYTITDIVNGNETTRTVESDTLPTLIRFGAQSGGATNRELSLLDVHYINGEGLTSCHRMFRNCNNVRTIAGGWNITNKVTDMYGLFANCSLLTSLDLSGWDTSNVTDMYSVFTGCTSLTTLNLSDWDLSSATNTVGYFYNCTKLNNIIINNTFINGVVSELPSVNNGSIIIVKDRFDGSISSLDINSLSRKGWDVVEKYLVVKYKYDMTINKDSNPTFNNEFTNYVSCGYGKREVYSDSLPTSIKFNSCSSLLGVYEININNANDMSNMFNGCNQLASLDLSNIDTSKVTSMENMFNNCSSLSLLDLSNFNTSEVINMENMFNGCDQLTHIGILYSNKNTCETIQSVLPNVSGLQRFIYVQDTKASDYVSSLYTKFINYANQATIILPQQLSRVGDLKDRLYWDNDKGYYCIEQNISNDCAILERPTIIDLPHLNKKYALDTYVPITYIECLNSPVQPSSILLQSDVVKYKPSILKSDTEYTLQFNCKEKGDKPIKLNLGGAEKEVEAILGVNHVNITTPSELSHNELELSGIGNKVSEVMVIDGVINQYPNYFDGVQSIGKLQEDGSYKIDIKTNENFTVSIQTDLPLGKEDRLYWNNINKRYEIDRSGVIEVPIVEGEVIDLPRLYQREYTVLTVGTDNIKPSEIKVEYKDLN